MECEDIDMSQIPIPLRRLVLVKPISLLWHLHLCYSNNPTIKVRPLFTRLGATKLQYSKTLTLIGSSPIHPTLVAPAITSLYPYRQHHPTIPSTRSFSTRRVKSKTPHNIPHSLPHSPASENIQAAETHTLLTHWGWRRCRRLGCWKRYPTQVQSPGMAGLCLLLAVGLE